MNLDLLVEEIIQLLADKGVMLDKELDVRLELLTLLERYSCT